MPFKTAERVYETSATLGSGEYALDGAQVGFQPFSVMGVGNLCPYFATDDTGWEVGIGTILGAPSRLARTTILSSSNAGAAVNWGAGPKKLRCGPLASLAVPRTLSKDVAGGAGTTVLTQDEQRRSVLVFTGVLTGNRTIELDATPWRWVVYNNTTGAFTLTVKVAGQTGVEVKQGRRAMLFCDGVDVEAGSPSLPAATDSEFDAGTRMLFQQTAAPTGWVKETNATYNDAALRMVTGTVATGGADAFTSTFGVGKSTAGHTLSVTDIPAHAHNHQYSAVLSFLQGGGADGNCARAAAATDSVGGGGAHSHNQNNFNLKYADCIIASRS